MISIVMVPGVKVIELPYVVWAKSDFNLVLKLKTCGSIFSFGDKTSLATKMLARIIW